MVISILIACSTSQDTLGLEQLVSASTAEDEGQPNTEEPDFDPGVDHGDEIDGEPPTTDPPEEREWGTGACAEDVAASIGERTYGGLQAALDAFGPADEAVWVCPGVHNGPFFKTANYEVVLLGAGDGVTDTVLTTDSGSVLTVFTWRGGEQGEPGRFYGRDFVVMGGSADQGGGIYATAQEVHLENVIVRDGTATIGGGVFVDGQADAVVLEGVEFFDNAAVNGGGFFIGGGDGVNHLSLTDVAFFDNTATDAGGAMYIGDGDVDANLVGVYARGNSAQIGAAYRVGTRSDAEFGHFGMVGGGVHANSAESGALDAVGTVVVLVEDVDFGEGADDNTGFDVGGCNGDYGAGSSFVYWPEGGIYCEQD